MREPLVKWVTLEQAGAMAFLPLYLLRLKAPGLDAKRHYVVFCQTGSAVARRHFC